MLDEQLEFFVELENMKTTVRSLRNSIHCLSVLVSLFVCFWLATTVRAVSPTPDGGYPGANTAEGGAGALFSVATGSQNTGTGAQALRNNTGDRNTADGFQALVKNTTRNSNTAGGWRALFKNTTGDRNTASGRETLLSNTTGFENTATDGVALESNTTSNDTGVSNYTAIL